MVKPAVMCWWLVYKLDQRVQLDGLMVEPTMVCQWLGDWLIEPVVACRW
jgi:hypothetical protein